MDAVVVGAGRRSLSSGSLSSRLSGSSPKSPPLLPRCSQDTIETRRCRIRRCVPAADRAVLALRCMDHMRAGTALLIIPP